MEAPDFFKYATMLVIGMGAIAGVALSAGNPVIPILAMMGAMGGVIYMKTHVKDVKQDELIYKTSLRASKWTLWIFGPANAVIGTIILSLRKWLPPNLVNSGYFMSFTALAMLITYYVIYVYHSQKHRREW